MTKDLGPCTASCPRWRRVKLQAVAAPRPERAAAKARSRTWEHQAGGAGTGPGSLSADGWERRSACTAASNWRPGRVDHASKRSPLAARESSGEEVSARNLPFLAGYLQKPPLRAGFCE